MHNKPPPQPCMFFFVGGAWLWLSLRMNLGQITGVVQMDDPEEESKRKREKRELRELEKKQLIKSGVLFFPHTL